MSGYLADVAALTRKDLALELRARDTLPAMLLFVLGALTVFHFVLPAGTATTPRTGSSGSRSSSRRSSASRAHGCRSLARRARRARPRDTRPQRHLGRQDARRARVPRGHRGCRTACLHLFFAPLSAAALAGAALATVGICAVGSLASALASAGRGREVILPLLLLPLMIPVVIFAVGAAVSEEPGTYLLMLGVYDLLFAILSWATFEYVVTE